MDSWFQISCICHTDCSGRQEWIHCVCWGVLWSSRWGARLGLRTPGYCPCLTVTGSKTFSKSLFLSVPPFSYLWNEDHKNYLSFFKCFEIYKGEGGTVLGLCVMIMYVRLMQKLRDRSNGISHQHDLAVESWHQWSYSTG